MGNKGFKTDLTIKRGFETVFNVKPVYIGLVHLYYFEGPCRMANSEEVDPEYERMMHPQICENFDKLIKKNLDGVHGFNVMDPTFILRSDNMESPEEYFDEILKDADDIDLLIVGAQVARGDMVVELAERAAKYGIPVMVQPENCCMSTRIISQIHARGLEGYGFFNWEDAIKCMKGLRLRKAMAHTHVLKVVRFGDPGLLNANNFYNDNDVTKRLGVRFRGISLHELLDQIASFDPMNNHCTPGREGVNLTEEERKEVWELTDELCDGAEHVGMDRDRVEVSVRGWYVVQKLLKAYECNAFVMPCPDHCATRRANQDNLTFCLNHSLNHENGVASACEGDTIAVLSLQLLMAAANAPAYMGESMPLRYENGTAKFPGTPANTNKIVEDIENADENLYATFHSVANRKFHGFDAPMDPYAIRPFTYSKWGATLRHDFKQDVGQVITLCRFSPDCKKILIVKGTIKGGDNYLGTNCNQSVVYQVKDAMDLYQKQHDFGSHMSLAYGDYTEELKMFAQSVGLEVVEA